MSLLTQITQVCRRIGITAPAGVASSSDPQIIQLMALANDEGQDLADRYTWQALQIDQTFTTVATESQGAMSTIAGSDFRYILNDIMWNRTLLRPVFGPLAPYEWQNLKARNINGPWNQYRIVQNNLRFIPVPTAGQTVAFTYISRNWVTVNAGGTSSTWTADADTGLIDEEIMTLGVIWRWKSAKGLEYSEDYAKYERRVADLMARDGGKPMLNLAGGMGDLPAGIMVPIGNWSV